MTKQEKQTLMPIMVRFYNEKLSTDIQIWSKRYHQALKEIWKHPINKQRDEEILEKHKLGNVSQSKFEWDWGLLDLDKKYRGALRFNFT